jgi:hypothetical protein
MVCFHVQELPRPFKASFGSEMVAARAADPPRIFSAAMAAAPPIARA